MNERASAAGANIPHIARPSVRPPSRTFALQGDQSPICVCVCGRLALHTPPELCHAPAKVVLHDKCIMFLWDCTQHAVCGFLWWSPLPPPFLLFFVTAHDIKVQQNAWHGNLQPPSQTASLPPSRPALEPAIVQCNHNQAHILILGKNE